jgi:hypothetical protein
MIRTLFFVTLLLFTTGSKAGLVYHTSLRAGVNEFAVYDVATDQWTQLNPYKTGSNFAVSSSGDMFAYSGERNAIDKYNPLTDSWSKHLDAPFIGGTFTADTYNFFNLEVTDSGRFLLTGNNQSSLFYSDGGAWSSVNLGFNTGATGDYVSETNELVLNPYNGRSPVIIDAATFTQTTFTQTGNSGEWRRSGTYINGDYFIQTGGSDMERWDLDAAPNVGPTFITNTPNDLIWAATDGDTANGILYAADIVRNSFYSFDGNDWTKLANVSSSQYNHTTIAFVSVPRQDVPTPATLALMGLGLAGLGWRRRKA